MTIALADLLPLSDQGLSILHAAVESLACFIGYRYYKSLRRKQGDCISSKNRHFIILGAAIGSVLGSRAPGLLERGIAIDPNLCLTQKTIVGGLLGAWLTVELTKLLLKERHSSGDLFTPPLIVAMMIGRLGCFLAGRVDATYGLPTALPWAVDFGDGIARHPTQLYEFIFLLGLLLVCRLKFWTAVPSGSQFRFFLMCYFLFRLHIDSWKPLYRFTSWELSVTQWTAVLGIIFYVFMEGVQRVQARLSVLRYEHKPLFGLPAKNRSEDRL